MADRDLTCVSPEQRWIHVATEVISVFAIVPTLAIIATRNRPLNRTEKTLLWAIVVGSVIVDGWLIYRFVSGRSAQRLTA